MSRDNPLRVCPRCESATQNEWCCGLQLSNAAPWRMTGERVRHVHALAMGRKGLDEESYRLRLRAVGVESSKDLSRTQFDRLTQGLLALPDCAAWKAKQSARAQSGVAHG